MNLRDRPRIGVMGSASCGEDVRELARKVGLHIARAGAVLICGGRGGVMEAAARGAKDGNGITVGILPGGSDAEANPCIDIPIVTGMGMARNAINVLTSQAVIAIAGAYGTLSEIALARLAGIPVIGLRTWGLTSPQGDAAEDVIIAESPEKAVELALRSARRR